MEPLHSAVFVFILIQVLTLTCGQYTTAIETELREMLFNSEKYTPLQRPSQNVNVSVTLNIITINNVNVKDQTMSVTGYLSLSWFDKRLSWANNANYSVIPALFSTETYVWTPALMVTNSVNDVSVMTDSNIPMRINNNGRIVWEITRIFQTQCEIDITYYPFDSQNCDITVSSWGYTSRQISLQLDSNPVSKSFFRENGEWDLLNEEAATLDLDRHGENYSQLSFVLSMKRRPFFHILNTLFPIIIFAFLSCMTFKLPPDSGERMGYSLTVLLTYTVYISLISANIPTTSKDTCILTVYLIVVLALGASTVVFTIYLLYSHHKGSDRPVPAWTQRLCKSFLSKIVCYPECCSNSESAVSLTKYSSTKCENGTPREQGAVVKHNSSDYSWKQIVTMLDMLYLRLYLTITTVFTLIVVCIMTL